MNVLRIQYTLTYVNRLVNGGDYVPFDEDLEGLSKLELSSFGTAMEHLQGVSYANN